MGYRRFSWLVLAFAATATLAHQGVQNAAVKARMESMSALAKNMKILGKMAKGATPYDAKLARSAADAIADDAADTTTLFEPQEFDPKSEAKSSIWEDFGDFSEMAEDLEEVAADMSESIQSIDDVKAAVVALGKKCKSCHSVYRE